MTMCEKCGRPYIDDRRKIIFRDMEFCDINCFMQSRYFDINDVSEYTELQSDFSELLEDFKKSEDEKATAEALNEQIVKSLEEFLEKWDEKFETGNEDLDKILLEITKIMEDGDI